METIKTILFRLQTVVPASAPTPLPQSLSCSGKSSFLWNDELADLKLQWILRGTEGIRRAMSSVVNSPKYTGISWERSRLDMSLQQPTIIYYLYMMHPLFIDAILAGEVTKRRHESVGMKAAIARYHTLDNFPGVYVNILCRAEYPTSTKVSVKAGQWAGYSLKPCELRIVCNGIRRYLEGGNDAADRYAARVDAVYGHMHDNDRPKSSTVPDGIDYTAGQRRYGRSEDARKTACLWVEGIEVRLAPLESDARRWKLPLQQCFQEVGWGRNCQSRASKHTTHDGTNSLFGLVTAIVLHEYAGVFAIEQYQMARLIKPEDAGLMEVYCSILASSYWFWGGLNPVLAGNVPMKGKTSAKDPRLERIFDMNKTKNACTGLVKISGEEDEEKESRLRAMVIMCRKIQALEEKLQHIQKRKDLLARVLEEFSKVDEKSTSSELKCAWKFLGELLLTMGLDLVSIESALPAEKRRRKED
jgi:hypothetical protein